MQANTDASIATITMKEKKAECNEVVYHSVLLCYLNDEVKLCLPRETGLRFFLLHKCFRLFFGFFIQFSE